MEKLTKRELQIAELVSEGLTNRAIAERLFLSTHTIKAVLEQIYFKLKLHNRVQLAVYFLKNRNTRQQ